VTLDFPVQGWVASNVVPAQLVDGFKHAIYLYVITGISNELSTMANSQTSYNLGIHWWVKRRVQKPVF